MIKKLFISYSDYDRNEAFKIRDSLLKANYDVWIDKEGTRGTVMWTQAVIEAIDQADGVVLVWSPNAGGSAAVPMEIQIARVFRRPLFPVLAHRIDRIPKLPDEFQNLQVIHEGDLEKSIVELEARLKDPGRNSVDYVEPVSNSYISKPRNPYFVGRNSELKKLFVDTVGFQSNTKLGIPIAISGLAGIGKTHLALTFAYRCNVFFPHGVFWVDTPNGIVQEFEKLGNYLKIKKLKEERPSAYAARIKEELEKKPNGLVIFDNVTDIEEFRNWCPRGSNSCSVIFTTRKSPRGFAVRVMNLTELDADSAFKLIVSRRSNSDKIVANKVQREAFQKICNIIGNHPLALELCACRLQYDFVQPTDLLHDLEKDPLGHLAQQSQFQVFIDRGETNLLNILAKSYHSLHAEITDPYFLLMCWFAPHGINTELIISAYGKPKDGIDALAELADNSLIYRDTEKTVSLHPLVAQFGRSLSKTKNVNYSRKFVETIIEFLKGSTKSLPPEQVRAELPHVNEAITVSRDQGFWELSIQLNSYWAPIVTGTDTRIELLKEAAQLLEKHLPDEKIKRRDIFVQLGVAQKTKELFKEALADFEKAHKLYEESSTFDPGALAELQFEIGDLYLELGLYDEARKTLTRAQDTALNVALYDATTPKVTRIKQALAQRDLALGSFDAAEKAFAEVLIHRQQFHTSHPDSESSLAVSSSYADLSHLALERCDYKDAMAKAEKALAVAREYHGENDPVCGNLYLLLGTILSQSGHYREAQESLEKAQKSIESSFGKHHPSYARTLIALAETSRRLGNFKPALARVEVAVKILEDRYGKDHPAVADALEIQGKIHNHLCEFDNEEKTWKRILGIHSKAFSENHPANAATYYNYANLCHKRGEFDKAVTHLEKSLSITEDTIGKNNSSYFGRLIRLATCYYDQQNYSEAEEKLKDAQTLQKGIFGESHHPYIARMYQLQSEVDRRRGRFEEALGNIDHAISMKIDIYGPEHPSVADALEIKVKVCHHLGDTVQEKSLIDQALRIRKARYGESHPEVARSEHDLGSYCLRLGQYNDAIRQFEKSRRISESTYGKHHLEYIERTLYLANAHYEKGEHNASLELLKDLEEPIEKTISIENHYLKARWFYGMAEVHRRLGMFKDALFYIDQAIKMRKAIYGKVHPSVAEVLECQGKIYDHLCNFDEEEKIWQDIIDSKVYPENHPSLATTHYDYGNLCLRRGAYKDALAHFETALGITKKKFGKNHPEYFGRLIRLATCHFEMQNYSLAENELQEAENLLKAEDIFGKLPQHPYVARMYQLQSEVNRRLGRFDAAVANIDRAIEMKEKIYGNEHPSVAEALEIKIRVLHHLGHSEQEKLTIDRTLKIRKARYGEKHPEVGRSEHDLGSYYLQLGHYDDAVSHFENALEITESTYGKQHLEYVERSLNLANALNGKGKYRFALGRVEQLGDIIDRTIAGKNHYLKARRLQQMAELNRRLGKFEEALVLVGEAIEMKEAIYGAAHPSFAEALEIQGKIYDHLGQFHNEEQVWNKVLDIQSKVYPKDHPAIAITHYDYGNLCLRMGRLDEAQSHLETSIGITENSFGKVHMHYFGRLIRLATCNYEQQKYFTVREKLEEAQGLQKDIFGTASHPYIARMLQLQSEVNRQLGHFAEALVSIDQAIDIKEEIYGKDHPSVAEALEFKADLRLAQFQAEESKELLDRIERIRKAVYGEDHPDFANYQLRLAEYYSILDRYEEAQNLLKQSLGTCQRIFPPDHPEVIKRLVMSARLARISSDVITAKSRINEASEALGDKLQKEKNLITASVLKESALIKRKQGDYHDSLRALESATEIETTLLGTRSPAVIESMVNKVKLLIVFHRLPEAQAILENTITLAEAEAPTYKRLKADLLEQRGILETHRRQYDKAIATYDEAIKLKEQVLNKTNAALAKLLVEKAVALRTSGKYDAALESLEEAQNLLNPLFNENHLFFARICLESGRSHYLKKSYLAAKEQLEEARKIYQNQHAQDLREHAKALEVLGLVYLDTGFVPKASQLFGDALEIKKTIYNPKHPEIAETLYNEARAFLGMMGIDGSSEKLKEPARQKLEQASQILKDDEENSIDLKNAIENTISNL